MTYMKSFSNLKTKIFFVALILVCVFGVAGKVEAVTPVAIGKGGFVNASSNQTVTLSQTPVAGSTLLIMYVSADNSSVVISGTGGTCSALFEPAINAGVKNGFWKWPADGGHDMECWR